MLYFAGNGAIQHTFYVFSVWMVENRIIGGKAVRHDGKAEHYLRPA